MTNKPNWTDKLQAFTSLASLFAFIIIAVMTFKIQNSFNKYTFPIPSINFSFQPVKINHWNPLNVSFNTNDTIFLLITGYSNQKIKIHKVDAIQSSLNNNNISEPVITINTFKDNIPIVISPTKDGIINEKIPLEFDFHIRASNPEIWKTYLPLAIGYKFAIFWSEFETDRKFSYLSSDEKVFIIDF